MVAKEKNVLPIFIFPPEQIEPSKNKYFSNNSVQFMIESLKELNKLLKKLNSRIYFFKGTNDKVFEEIIETNSVNSIGFNIDYSPYALKRDKQIEKICMKNKIKYIKKKITLFTI